MPRKTVGKTSINDFKNRMDSPFVGVMIDPKTKKPLKRAYTKSTAKKK